MNVKTNGIYECILRALDLFDALAVEGPDGVRRVPVEASEYTDLLDELKTAALKRITGDVRGLFVKFKNRIVSPRIRHFFVVACCVVGGDVLHNVEQAIDEVEDRLDLPADKAGACDFTGRRIVFSTALDDMPDAAILIAALIELCNAGVGTGQLHDYAALELPNVRQALAQYLDPNGRVDGRIRTRDGAEILMATLLLGAQVRYEAEHG